MTEVNGRHASVLAAQASPSARTSSTCAVSVFAVGAATTAVLALVRYFSQIAVFSWPIGAVLTIALDYPLVRNQPIPAWRTQTRLRP